MYEYCLYNERTDELVRVNIKRESAYNGIYTHWVVAVDGYYRQVILEDGSIWSIASHDANELHHWRVNDIVIMGINDGWNSDSYPNILINGNRLGYVEAVCNY